MEWCSALPMQTTPRWNFSHLQRELRLGTFGMSMAVVLTSTLSVESAIFFHLFRCFFFFTTSLALPLTLLTFEFIVFCLLDCYCVLIIIFVLKLVLNSERVTFEGVTNAAPASGSRMGKKKIFIKAAEELKTTEDLFAAHKGRKMMTSVRGFGGDARNCM